MTRPIFRVNSIDEKKKINRFPTKETHHNKNQIFQRNQKFFCKRKPLKNWNKLMTLSKAFKNRHDWRITYLTLNPPLPECRFFIFGALSMPQRWLDTGKATLLPPIVRLSLCGSSGKVQVVWEATDHGRCGVLGKKIASKGSWGRS